MTTSYWETEKTYYEARVYADGSVTDLVEALTTMSRVAEGETGSNSALRWSLDFEGNCILLSVSGSSQSVGWEPKA